MFFLNGLILFGLLVFPFSAVIASDVEGLYDAEVPVKTQDKYERLRVYPEALSQVIVKLSGDTTAAGMAQLKSTVANARQLVQQYHYRQLSEDGNIFLKEQGYTHKLVVRFDGQAVTQALVQAGVALWGRTRPEMLVWLAVEDREVRYILGANASQELESHLFDASKRRGLPLLLPLMDLEDERKVRFADIWGAFRQPVLAASARYGVDVVLVGRLMRQQHGPWEVRWSLFNGRNTTHWQARSYSQAEAIGGGVDGAADQIAAQFAQVFATDANTRLQMTVTEVDDLKAYAKAQRYLRSLEAVVDVQVTQVYQGEVVFDVAIRTNRRSFIRDIALGDVLAASSAASQFEVPASGEIAAERMSYRLLP